MSHKCSLNTQSGKLWLIVRNGKPINLIGLHKFLGIYCDEYAYIIHEGDIDPLTGYVESTHLHCVCNLKKAYRRSRLSTSLSRIVECMEYDNGIGIEIEQYDSFEGCCQYLIHKNDPNKTQHSISEVVTNIDQDSFKFYMGVELGAVFSYDRVISVCMTSNNKLEVIRTLWGFYSRNPNCRNVINDIWNEYKNGKY